MTPSIFISSEGEIISNLPFRPRPHVSGYFLSGYGYRPHAYGEFASKSGNFLIRSPERKFFNPITFRIRLDGRIRIFSDTMSSQNWRQYLPRKFKHSRRSKANSFCAPWLISSLLACMQLNLALLNAEISYARRRLGICKLFTLSIGQNVRQKQLKRVGKQCRPRRFWVRPGRTSA